MTAISAHRTILQIIVLHIVLLPTAYASEAPLLTASRKSCAQVWSEDAKVQGTAFFIGTQHVVTCHHVIASWSIQNNQLAWKPFGNVKIKTSDGETIEANLASIPTPTDPSPIQYDFAILKLKSTPKSTPVILRCCNDDTAPDVGTDAFFSGYPLATPAMVTHKAMISGVDPSGDLLCLQSAINKGNSGGALVNANHEVIGIITLREGGISKGLQDLTTYIQSQPRAQIFLSGVDPLVAIGITITTLDEYISTGIGYARTVRHLRLYLESHPELLK